jgi:8-oxo-dGTP diphosphatase
MPLYACRKWDGIVQGKEGQELAWVRAQDLNKYSMPPADIPIIPILRDWL